MTIAKMFNVDFPLIQSPMAGVQDWRLAVSVSEAGGLGSIPCGMLSPEQVEQALIHYKQHASKPYNLNFFCHDMPRRDYGKEQAWLDRLSLFYRELGLECAAPDGALRMPFNEAMATAIEPFRPPVISFHFGLPDKALVDRVKSWGTIIMSSATTLQEAVWLEDAGVDVVIAQGVEAGGHRGMFKSEDLATQKSTESLLIELVNCLSVPVVAAGGIANAEHASRMLGLGAAGVQVGTAFLLCDEVNISEAYRSALQDVDANTSITNVFSGRPARGIDNRVMRELGFMSDLAPDFPYAAIAMAPLRAYAGQHGALDFLPLWAGTDRSACKKVPAKELVASFFSKR